MRKAEIRPLADLSDDHLRNVARMLSEMASTLHMAAVLDVVINDDSSARVLELALYELTGSSLATVSPRAWLRATPLLRAIQKELVQRNGM